jgi:deoxyribodipyrimidine photolyase-related protein
MEVIQTAINAYSTQDNIDISQVEGFVRQILGWREFVRGIYWANMPSYAHLNHLSATRNLPDFYWTGETKMNCISQTVNQSLDHAYAHHIQRLMITGTFALLAGIDPDQVDSWYLGIYADAIEWVQLPNTRGMSQFADGGMIASKPYIASGNYVNQMSDYCRSCHYDVKDKVTSQSCPFNSMYWRFLNTHREKFSRNPRIGMAYRNWDGFDPEIQQKVLERGEIYLSELESL